MAEDGKTAADPFEGCIIPRCHANTDPLELFCDGHEKLVPLHLKRALRDEIEKKETDLKAWHALVREAAKAVSTQPPATT